MVFCALTISLVSTPSDSAQQNLLSFENTSQFSPGRYSWTNIPWKCLCWELAWAVSHPRRKCCATGRSCTSPYTFMYRSYTDRPWYRTLIKRMRYHYGEWNTAFLKFITRTILLWRRNTKIPSLRFSTSRKAFAGKAEKATDISCSTLLAFVYLLPSGVSGVLLYAGLFITPWR